MTARKPIISPDADMTIGKQASLLQGTASDPSQNVWVNASAGTGKTKVLTERVLRLLLPVEGKNDGTPPENILCVTFTKAGANEMITRLMGILSLWAVCPSPKLAEELEKLLGQPPSLKQTDKARKLFAMVIDLPNGLNVTTIHALCQSILGRFSIEAGLQPNFSVMEDGESQGAIRTARDGLVRDILDTGDSHPLYNDFTWLASIKNSDQIHKILNTVLGERKKLNEFFKANPDYRQSLRALLDIGQDETEATVIERTMMHDLPENDIRRLAKALEHGTPTNQNAAFCLYDILNGDRIAGYYAYKALFLKQDGEPRQESAVTKKARDYDDEAVLIFTKEADRLYQTENRLKSLLIYQATVVLLNLAKEITRRYQNIKLNQRKVDYDDLIHKTLELLSGPRRDWVLFKLDYAIDHILVDEAQDTSPDQWAILQALWEDFFTGESARNTQESIDRTLFVVGDNKQSIFSFQGANISIFNTVHDTIMTRVTEAGQPWQNIPMNTSFRSTSAVLDFVDTVFMSDALKVSLTQNPDLYKPHTAFRQGQAGVVELWPLYKVPAQEALPAWTLPVTVREGYNASRALANRIAETIANWIGKEILQSKGRPVAAGDIMILVRRRNAFVDHLIRALKTHNVAVSGADRLVIANHIGVQDILAAFHFALMPDDDLMLATLLKSPFIGWDDTIIEDYAYGRDNSLWQEIKTRAPDLVRDWLSRLIATSGGQNAFHAVSDILNYPSANGQLSGWQALMTRLGEDCIDPLEELLSMAQTYDANHPGKGLQGFLHFMQTNKTDIKRELDNADDKVRIMTVHASKGLQAPIVFMPDTTMMPKASTSDDGLVWHDNGLPLWSPSAATNNDLMGRMKTARSAEAEAEYYRLMYVAMTRAEDRLIICGTLNNNQNNIPEKTWYGCALQGMSSLPYKHYDWHHDESYQIQDFDSPYYVYQTEQTAQLPVLTKKSEGNNRVRHLPDWVTSPLKTEQNPPRVLKPSQDEDAPLPVRSPLSYIDDSYRFRRGLLTHSLLQYLPDLPVMERAHAGRDYLNRQAPDVSDNIRSEILSESLAILNSPEFAQFFGEGSLAEVPVTGTVPRSDGKYDIISGQIDRMLITDDTIWIIDFKSNRPPPRDPNDVPAQYVRQLSAYKTLIQSIYPDHAIKCGLLWTDGPFMTVLKNI